ncbi:CinA family protein [Ruania albidiflava]|uniref:CinA family protein n=1 Tax=Ruania albidiflava TaxID=366586 RepID=UPI0003B458A8|nr:nicotinamide-nucleotide amidohydrolase family protein [Ruania albidiflava]
MKPPTAAEQSTDTRGVAAQVLARLRAAGTTIAVAESLTGGLLGAELVAVPGASAVFRGGVLAYATDSKASVLGVDMALLMAQGPVHPQVAVQMADGVRSLFEADLALATTGVAGPGPADGHPAGTIYVACSGVGRTPAVRGHRLAGTRPETRAAAVQLALALLLD